MKPETSVEAKTSESAPRFSPPRTVEPSGPRRLTGVRAIPYESGDVLADKYELDTVLGTGSMGEVWRATNRALELEVAIKLLRWSDESLPSSDAVPGVAIEEHLLREAQATAKVSHPSVVRIFDFGVTDRGVPFIVMEKLDGEDLRAKLVREEKLAPIEAVQLLLPVMHGMQAAHVLGVVHRDLKPENIFLARSDERLSPKVLDFGIADLGWVKNGIGSVVCGTPDYMAPEQVNRNPKPDHRADIWSICVVLYEAITGSLPPSFDDHSQAWLDVDPALRAIVERGLAEAPSDRWRSMADIGEALAEWLAVQGIDEDCQGFSLHARWLYNRSATVPAVVATKAEPEIEVELVDPREVIQSEFPAPDELGPVELPVRRGAAWLLVATAIGAVAGGAYLVTHLLATPPRAEAAPSDVPAVVVAPSLAAQPTDPIPATAAVQPVPTTERSIAAPVSNASAEAAPTPTGHRPRQSAPHVKPVAARPSASEVGGESYPGTGAPTPPPPPESHPPVEPPSAPTVNPTDL